MEFAFKGRGMRVTAEVREAAEHKLGKFARMEPRATVLEIEVIAQHNPRLKDGFTVEGALKVPRKTFRAHGEGSDVPSAIDQLAERLERQVRDAHSRRRSRPTGKGNGLESAHA